MINNYTGTRFIGASVLQTSVAGAEVLTNNPRVFNLTFQPDQPCTIKVNGYDDAIYIKAAQTVLFPVCNSLIVVEGGITFNYIGQLG